IEPSAQERHQEDEVLTRQSSGKEGRGSRRRLPGPSYRPSRTDRDTSGEEKIAENKALPEVCRDFISSWQVKFLALCFLIVKGGSTDGSTTFSNRSGRQSE